MKHIFFCSTTPTSVDLPGYDTNFWDQRLMKVVLKKKKMTSS